MKKFLANVMIKFLKSFKWRSEREFFYVNTDALDRDRLEIHLSKGRPLGGLS